MTATRKAKKQAKADPDFSPGILRMLRKVLNSPSQRFTGTHEQALAMGKPNRKKKTPLKKKIHG